MKIAMKKITFKFNPKYLTGLTGLAILALFGASAVIVLRTVTVGADEAYLNAQRQKIDSEAVKIDRKAVELVKNLYKVNGSTDISNLGKEDPFAL